jgi:hypothetical protein
LAGNPRIDARFKFWVEPKADRCANASSWPAAPFTAITYCIGHDLSLSEKASRGKAATLLPALTNNRLS